MRKYPSLEEVEAASHLQLAGWARHLPSPGMSAVDADRDAFEAALEREQAIIDRIMARFAEAGGWNPTLSKAVGW